MTAPTRRDHLAVFRITHSLCAASILIALTLTTGCRKQSPATPPPPPPQLQLTIAAAASVRPALEAIIAQYKLTAPGMSIQTTFGASGTLYAQITNRAPLDLFYSADTKYPQRLADDGLCLAGSQRIYALGQLALVLRRDTGVDPSATTADALQSPAVKHIAIANPELAPYGRAAKQAIAALGLDAALTSKLVLGENVEQAAQFLQSGAAQAAFLPLGLAQRPGIKDSVALWTLPAEIAPPIQHGMVILASTTQPDAARHFDAFVAAPDGRRILTEHGFTAPGWGE